MPYILKRLAPKRRIGWIGLAELVEFVQAKSACSVDEARAKIRDALEDGAIWHVSWHPRPAPSYYCHYVLDKQATGFDPATPVFPPPLVPGMREHFIDLRRASHWQDIKIDWERGRVFDDFEREAERRLNREQHREQRTLREALPFLDLAPLSNFTPPYPKPQRPKWRTLMFNREACEREWQPALNVSKAHIGGNDGQTNLRYPKGTKLEAVRQYIQETYPRGIPAGVTYKMIAAELKAKNITVGVRTIRRALGGK